jgi:hypothetical protein
VESEGGRGPIPAVEVDLATAIGNPWRCRILAATAGAGTSPSAFCREHGGGLSNVSRHFRRLCGWGWLEVVEVRLGGSRRGGIEHVYRHGAAARRTGEAFWAELARNVC